MGKYIIYGGRKLSGTFIPETAKNAVMPMLAASILTDEQVVIKNCPKISDVYSMVKILNSLGAKTYFNDNNLVILSKSVCSHTVLSEHAKTLRSSIFMLGALISRFKKAEVSLPGGCDIGKRPIDIHLDVLKAMGCETVVEDECVRCKCDKLKGCSIKLSFASVGATENAILAGVKANGTTVIHNAAREPEIVDLVNFLKSMGAKISGEGTKTITIEGVKRLHGTEYLPIPDRIETGTFLIATAITGGEIEVKGFNAENILPLIHKLCENACKISIKNDIIYLKKGAVSKSFSFVTGPHPLFPTDLQAQAMSLACLSVGQSVIRENVFENRFRHVAELRKLGADITVLGRAVVINGVKSFCPAELNAEDLRGGAALVLAALATDGVSFVNNTFHIERGYAGFDEKLRLLGADIKVTT